MIQEILDQSGTLERTLTVRNQTPQNNSKTSVSLVVLTGTPYEKKFIDFAERMNQILASEKLKIEVVRSTAPTIGRLLFNNNNNSSIEECSTDNCVVCVNNLQNKSGVVKSSVTGTEYKISKNLTCNNGGIYILTGQCRSQ